MPLNKEMLWSDLFLIGHSCSHQAARLTEWSRPRAFGPNPKMSPASYSILIANVKTAQLASSRITFQHMTIWQYDNMTIWEYDNMTIWQYVNCSLCFLVSSHGPVSFQSVWYERANVDSRGLSRALLWFHMALYLWLLMHLWAIASRVSKQMDQMEMASFGHAVAMPISSYLQGGYEALLRVS